MIRAADTHSVQPPGGAQGNHGPAGQDHGQGAGPEFLRQQVGRLRHLPAVALQPAGIRYMENQRVILRTALGLENVQHGILIEGIGPQAVHGLRGDAQQAARAEDLRRPYNLIFPVFGVKYPCFQIDFPFLEKGFSPVLRSPGPRR